MRSLAILLIGALPASAEDLCPLIARLNETVRAETGLAPVPCPPVSFTELGGTGLRSQSGAFFPETGRIALAPDLDMTTAYGQSYLLHELVHAAQIAAGVTPPCPAALEAEAYGVQARFLMAAGLRDLGLRVFLRGTQLGSCGEADY